MLPKPWTLYREDNTCLLHKRKVLLVLTFEYTGTDVLEIHSIQTTYYIYSEEVKIRGRWKTAILKPASDATCSAHLAEGGSSQRNTSSGLLPAPPTQPPPGLADCMIYPALRQRGCPFNSYAFVLEPRLFKFPFLHFVIGFYSAFFWVPFNRRPVNGKVTQQRKMITSKEQSVSYMKSFN